MSRIHKFVLFVCLTAMPVYAIAANDKKQIELTCGEAKATITCTKFGKVGDYEDVCLKSTVEFQLKNGRRIISHDKPPQNFVTPTIADELSCETRNGKYYFTVWYSPDCSFAQCTTIYHFSESGKIIAMNSKKYKKLMTAEPTFIGQTQDLRGER